VQSEGADLERSLAFTAIVLGFAVSSATARRPILSPQADTTTTSVSTRGRAQGGAALRPARPTVPRCHPVIRHGPELADAVRRVVQAGLKLDGAADHGVSEAVYLRDPDTTVLNCIGTGR